MRFSRRSLGPWAATIVFLLWLVFSLSGYYVVNKPITFPISEQTVESLSSFSLDPTAFLSPLLNIAVALWIMLAALGLGIRVIRSLSLQIDAPETLLLGMGLGLGLLGLMVLFIGLIGWLAPLPLSVFALVLGLLAVPVVIPLMRDLRRPRPGWPLSVYLFVLLGASLSLALLPPTSWDALFYHLKGPSLYLEAGAIRPGVDVPHLSFPSLLEMLFLLAMGLHTDITAKLLHFAFALLAGGMTYLTAVRSLKVEGGWWAPVFFYATPLVPLLATWAYNDLALAFYTLASLYAFLRWQEIEVPQWLFMSALFAGFAMGLKYTSFITPTFIALAILWRYRRRVIQGIRPLLLFSLPALLLVIPWLVKNWFFTGNPVYPFVFDGVYWDEYRSIAYGEPGTGIGLDPIALLRLPLDMTLGYRDASQEAGIGPLYLVFLPLLLFYGLRKGERALPGNVKLLALYVLVSYVFWAVGVVQSRPLWQARLFLPALTVLCPILAWILEDIKRFDRPQFSLHHFLKLVVVFALVLNLVTHLSLWLEINPIPYLSGSESRSGYLQRRLGLYYDVMQTINRELPEDAKVIFLWEPRSYYCNVDCWPDSILDRWGHLVYQYDGASTIAAQWREVGVTHVLFFEAGFQFMQDADPPQLSAAEVEVLEALHDSYLLSLEEWQNIYQLYAFEAADSQ